MSSTDWSLLGVNLTHAATGAVGGLIRGFVRPNISVGRRIAATIVGAFTAGYGTSVAAPVVVAFLADYGVPADATKGLMGFLLGVVGITLCEGAIRLAERWRDDPRLPGRD